MTHSIETMTAARKLVGSDINDLEYIDHIVIQDNKTYFQIIHLDGHERIVEITEILN